MTEIHYRTRFGKCPGCGDLGDVDHVVACVNEHARHDNRNAQKVAGEVAVGVALGVVMKQMDRRGSVDLEALRAALWAALL